MLRALLVHCLIEEIEPTGLGGAPIGSVLTREDCPSNGQCGVEFLSEIRALPPFSQLSA